MPAVPRAASAWACKRIAPDGSPPDTRPAVAACFSALKDPARFEAAMALRPCARSLHFSLHFRGHEADSESKLSTGAPTESSSPVDDSPAPAAMLHLGMVVPKRHARRSVTRNLVKRQVREQVRLNLAELPAGDWVLRLRAPLDRQQFHSAASQALRAAVRAELISLLADARRRATRGAGYARPAPARHPG